MKMYSKSLVRLLVPCDYEMICFVNETNVPMNQISNPIILQEYDAGTGNNVFLIKGKIVEPFLSEPNIDVVGGYFCAPTVAGNFNLVLSGIGGAKKVNV